VALASNSCRQRRQQVTYKLPAVEVCMPLRLLCIPLPLPHASGGEGGHTLVVDFNRPHAFERQLIRSGRKAVGV
jgi:hypothetical protein